MHLGWWVTRNPGAILSTLTYAVACSIATKVAYQCAIGFSGVVFGLIVVDNSLTGATQRSIFGLFYVPAPLYPWTLLVIWQLIMPGVSFLGHLCGLLVTHACCLLLPPACFCHLFAVAECCKSISCLLLPPAGFCHLFALAECCKSISFLRVRCEQEHDYMELCSQPLSWQHGMQVTCH